MATFNGAAIFGRAATLNTGDLILQRQENEFAGVDGVETLTLGSRGLMTEASGVLFGATSADLATAEATFRSYRDGNAYSLVDSYGNTWANVVLETFRPEGRIRQDAYYGYFRPYRAVFRHLTTS